MVSMRIRLLQRDNTSLERSCSHLPFHQLVLEIKACMQSNKDHSSTYIPSYTLFMTFKPQIWHSSTGCHLHWWKSWTSCRGMAFLKPSPTFMELLFIQADSNRVNMHVQLRTALVTYILFIFFLASGESLTDFDHNLYEYGSVRYNIQVLLPLCI